MEMYYTSSYSAILRRGEKRLWIYGCFTRTSQNIAVIIFCCGLHQGRLRFITSILLWHKAVFHILYTFRVKDIKAGRNVAYYLRVFRCLRSKRTFLHDILLMSACHFSFFKKHRYSIIAISETLLCYLTKYACNCSLARFDTKVFGIQWLGILFELLNVRTLCELYKTFIHIKDFEILLAL